MTYDPKWSAALPFKTYSGGTARRIFGSLHVAIRYCGEPLLEKWEYHP